VNETRRRGRGGRALLGGAIVAAWVGGLGTLVYREYLDPTRDRLADAARRVEPSALFFSAMQAGRQIGYGSSTVDTTSLEVRISEVLRVELPVGGRTQTASARTRTRLSRSLALLSFSLEVNAESGTITTSGEWESDSVFTFVARTGGRRQRPDTQRVTVAGPIYYPSAVPMAVMLAGRPSVGRSMLVRVADPIGMTVREARVRLRAETLFVVNDSAVIDETTRRWREARPDTVRAWKLDPGEERTLVEGWVDAQGRIVDALQLGTVQLQRKPFEVSVQNWRTRSRAADTVSDDRDILELTAIAADRRIATLTEAQSYRLGGVPLGGFELDGTRQRLSGDTLHVRRERAAAMRADYGLPEGARERFVAETSPAPLLESEDPAIVAQARRIAGTDTDPERVARRINDWVHANLQKRVTFGIPSARQVLRRRTGDCNEHTQLYVALARAAGIPARIAAGLVHIDGKFYYHAWPEVRLGEWVAVDPTLGQFPADAAHLRFVSGGLDRQGDLLGLIGRLTIDVLDD
jgi:transglutaminase-like putative cysteine protease